MFFCDRCAKRRDWPTSFMKSEGPCEVCGKIRICNDIPSRHLPLPKKYQKKK